MLIFDNLDIKGLFCHIDCSFDFGFTFLYETFTKESIMNIIKKFVSFRILLVAGTLIGGMMCLEGWPHGEDNPKQWVRCVQEMPLPRAHMDVRLIRLPPFSWLFGNFGEPATVLMGSVPNAD